ncbi:BTAD domain-containing putative transcriptional regulator [Streptomyces sp. NPDC002033]|uniref:AfsR/SARP family transcriptional regulator n=1 Tax=unclassified Streptomyces TaxID=2593676 RepID=UPI003323905F
MTGARGEAEALRWVNAGKGAARVRRPRGPVQRPVGITLSGGFRLLLDGQEIELPGGAQRLVALLALRGRTGRSSLAGTLWPETDENRALARLRTAMWRVNLAVPSLMTGVGGCIDLSAHVEVDVREQIDCAMKVLHGTGVVMGSWATYVPAGDLLPDWEDEWLIDDRERLRQLRLHVLEDIAVQLCEQGRFGLAIDTALTVLRADDLRESAHRTLLRVHLAEGNLSEARRAYRVCVELFERELGVRPTSATSDLLMTAREVSPGSMAQRPCRS